MFSGELFLFLSENYISLFERYFLICLILKETILKGNITWPEMGSKKQTKLKRSFVEVKNFFHVIVGDKNQL